MYLNTEEFLEMLFFPTTFFDKNFEITKLMFGLISLFNQYLCYQLMATS
jgi:hypothetical protein